MIDNYVRVITIYTDNIKIMAQVSYVNDPYTEIIEWNNVSERQRVLSNINGYTLINDTRVSK